MIDEEQLLKNNISKVGYFPRSRQSPTRQFLLDHKSYAQQYLLDLIVEHKLFGFWKDNLSDKEYSYMHLYNIATTLTSISLPLIWCLRKIINPIFWFETIDNPKPKKIPIENTNKEYDYTKTKNFKYLQKEVSPNIQLFCNKTHLSYDSVYQLIKKRRKLTFFQIFYMKEIIPVKNWFIYE